ncbi:hypothetical protein SAMN02799630_04006 [Paenibacillus sp. UNCCL117]|uniref:hypothetical protein n=1 Tax=unclassified Paenibacillus TaxID=185978 RepID=UPI000887A558|nr:MULTISPECIES: hypothetical protein [unclassified Paenibacillus]SDD77568.1 hypothetical protein SAMN04488602_11371 [Paenibacillus sp. cl123]SFW52759.1 hypothetical protein SAMN02799630_04006 [Paenibacillus sp. UNCCL117]
MSTDTYANLIGVVIEKLIQTHKELQFNYEGLSSILGSHSEEERASVPELITMAELRDGYLELLQSLEKRFPGVK